MDTADVLENFRHTRLIGSPPSNAAKPNGTAWNQTRCDCEFH